MTSPTSAKASTVAADEAFRKELTSQRHSNGAWPKTAVSKLLTSRSTATEAQNDKLAELLVIAPRHTHELRRLGISHPAGRIQDLEVRGYVIESDRVTTVDDFGFTHKGVARYSIISRPEPIAQAALALDKSVPAQGTAAAGAEIDALLPAHAIEVSKIAEQSEREHLVRTPNLLNGRAA